MFFDQIVYEINKNYPICDSLNLINNSIAVNENKLNLPEQLRTRAVEENVTQSSLACLSKIINPYLSRNALVTDAEVSSEIQNSAGINSIHNIFQYNYSWQ